MHQRRGFSLVEIIVVLGVFALVVLLIGAVFVTYQDVWQRQKTNLETTRTLRQTMELITNDLRETRNPNTNPGGIDAGRGVCFSGSAANECYWRGDSLDDLIPQGSVNFFYHGAGENINQAYAVRGKICGYIVDNPIDPLTGLPYPVFADNAGLITVILTARPSPEKIEAKGNRNYILRTKVRTRN